MARVRGVSATLGMMFTAGRLCPSRPNARLPLSSQKTWNRPLPINELIFVVTDGLLFDRVRKVPDTYSEV
jgi:hypothetical protein